MAVKKTALSICLALSLAPGLFAAPAWLEKAMSIFSNKLDTEGANDEALEVNNDYDTYKFKLDTDGQYLYTQVLTWDGDPNASAYDIEVRGAKDEELAHQKVTEPKFEISLKPGDYTYRITFYNLLDKPETQTPWADFRVIKAELPAVESVSPRIVDLDTNVRSFKLHGSKLMSGAEFWLVDSGTGRKFRLTEAKREGTEDVSFDLPEDDSLRVGYYSLRVVNPGGLSVMAKKALRVRYQRPADLLATAGYSPFIALYDDYLTADKYFFSYFYPLGASAALRLYFVKQRWGFVGAELSGQYQFLNSTQELYSLDTHYALAELSGIYTYLFTKKIRATARLGGGVAYSYWRFRYRVDANSSFDSYGEPLSSLDPFITGGLAFHLFFNREWGLEIGANSRTIFHDGQVLGGIVPFINATYQLY
jgi:hypothetical protein